MFGLVKRYTATFYFKSGNIVVVDDIKTYTVDSTGGKPTSFEFTYFKPKIGLTRIDLDEVEALVIR